MKSKQTYRLPLLDTMDENSRVT